MADREGPINSNVLVCNGCKYFSQIGFPTCTHPESDIEFYNPNNQEVNREKKFVKDGEDFYITPTLCPYVVETT